MQSNDGCFGSIILLAIIAAAIWYFWGSGAESIAVWQGHSTYEYEFGELEKAVNQRTIGSGRDVWLTKNAFGTIDRVALFFGYVDDVTACNEVAQLLNARYPDANFNCIYASQ